MATKQKFEYLISECWADEVVAGRLFSATTEIDEIEISFKVYSSVKKAGKTQRGD